MADDPSKPDALPRRERLAAALRANLRRRKAQARGRGGASEGPPGEEPGTPEAPGDRDAEA